MLASWGDGFCREAPYSLMSACHSVESALVNHFTCSGLEFKKVTNP